MAGQQQLAVAEEQPDLLAGGPQHAGVAGAPAQQGGVGQVAGRDPVAQPAALPERAAGEEPVHLGVRDLGRVQAAHGGGEGLQPLGQAVGEQPGLVEVAGRQVLGAGLVEGRGQRPVQDLLPGHLVDPDGDVQGDGVLGAGGVRGAGGEVHADAGLQHDGLRLLPSAAGSCTSHTLLPWVWNTKTSWESLCTAKPCEPGGVR